MKTSLAWAGLFGAAFFWSLYQPVDYFIWLLEALPAMIGVVVLAVTRRRFPLTPLVYILILVHCVILLVGAHYTYAQVPLFDYLKPVFGFERNNYDKLGHLAQGFVPVMIAREIAIRRHVFNGRGWMNFFIVCFCLALSAFYEMIEWWVAVATGESAEAFLAIQNYPWDTQSDMGWALLGAVTALLLLASRHDRQLNRLSAQPVR